MKYIFLLIILLPVLLQANCQLNKDNWIAIGETKGEIYYMRNEYISKIGNEIRIWTKTTYPKWTTAENKTFYNATIKSLLLIDCSLKKEKMLAYHIYDENNTEIGGADYEETNVAWDNIPPDTPIEKVVEAICKRFNKKE